MGEPHEFGRTCEAAAASALISAGWRILERNFRSGHREIDIVARRGSVVAFVEVKGRRGPGYGHPLEAITRRKRREIQRVAQWWVVRHGRRGDVYRFDAIAVTLSETGGVIIEHVEDAWRP